MFVSAFETALLIIMWMYIYEFKMRTAERINKLEGELYEATYLNCTRQAVPVEEYDRSEYSRRVSALLDMALRQS
jgi:hypothetical protein